MARTRCGPCALSSLKLKLPLASALVRPASSIPWLRLSRTTSSPAAGLPVVAFLTVPVRVWAEAKEERRKTRKIVAPRGPRTRDARENSCWSREGLPSRKGSFDCVFVRLSRTKTSLRTTGGKDGKGRVAFMISVFSGRRAWLPGGRFRLGAWRPRLAARLSVAGNPRRGLCRLCIRSSGHGDFRRRRLCVRGGRRRGFFPGPEKVFPG